MDAVNVQNVKKVWGQAPAPVDNKMDSHYNSSNNLNVVSNPANQDQPGSGVGMELVPVIAGGAASKSSKLPQKDNKKEMLAN